MISSDLVVNKTLSKNSSQCAMDFSLGKCSVCTHSGGGSTLCDFVVIFVGGGRGFCNFK